MRLHFPPPNHYFFPACVLFFAAVRQCQPPGPGIVWGKPGGTASSLHRLAAFITCQGRGSGMKPPSDRFNKSSFSHFPGKRRSHLGLVEPREDPKTVASYYCFLSLVLLPLPVRSFPSPVFPRPYPPDPGQTGRHHVSIVHPWTLPACQYSPVIPVSQTSQTSFPTYSTHVETTTVPHCFFIFTFW